MITAGQTIGNYRIVSKIGTGGMGAVYLAEHPLIGKRVALKVIHRELAGNRDVVQRFFQEARAVNKIGNEHIVEIHDFGVTPEGDHFYIMEYLEGHTLASVLSRETALDGMRALHIGAQIASALAAAHASGVIHRDLKPDNIMLMSRLGDPDFVKVLDFGLAKMFQAQGASAVQTAAGVLLGTPQYMSPEACESKRDIDHRTDIYALGVLMFQMMTGVLPFDGDSMGEVLVKQVTALPPAPRGLNPAIPPAVEQILLRCLAKPVDARFPTMQKLREALLDPEAYLRGSPPIAPARSVAPGEARVDGRQALAAAEARTRMMDAQALPLPAPAGHTMIDGAAGGGGAASRSKQMPVPGLAQPASPKMNTMRIATPLGYSSQPPRRVWPIVLVVGLLLGLGGGAFAVAWFGRKQPAGDEGGTSGSAGSGATGSASVVGSGSAVTAGSGSAVTAGSGSAVTSGSGGAVTAGSGSAVTSGSGSAVTAGSGSAVTAGSGSAVTAGSGSAVTAGSAAGARVKLTLDSAPAGATVLGPDGASLGKTPFSIDWPTSTAPVKLTFRLRGYRDKATELSVTEATLTRVDLERIPTQGTPPGRGSGSSRRDDGNGLERPD